MGGLKDRSAKSKLNAALDHAQELQELVDALQDPKADPAPRDLLHSMSRTIADPTKEPTFGSVSLSDGRRKGVATGGLVGLATQIASAGILVARVDLKVSRSKDSSLTLSRDSQGIQMQLVSDAVTTTGGASLDASVGLGFGGDGGPAFVGAGGALSHSASKTDSNDGVILRLPKFNGKTHEQLTDDFGGMIETMLTWQDYDNEDGQPLYRDALQALLHQHPEISVSSVQESSLSHTAVANAGLFGGVSLPVGDNGGDSLIAGSLGVGTSSTRRRDDFATTSGTQGLEGVSVGRQSDVSLYAGALARLGGSFDAEPRLAGVRARVLRVGGEVTLHQSVDQAGASLLRQPDGAIVADRSVEYSDFRKFEAAINAHREKWIRAGVQAGHWPEGLSDSDKRIAASDALDQFMDTAKTCLKSGSVTLNETMDLKFEVGAELTANLALDQLARSDRRHIEADALRAAREKLLADDASYEAFWLKLFDRGSSSQTTGVNFVVQSTKTQAASATHMAARFPLA